jgi:hypothetical protein
MKLYMRLGYVEEGSEWGRAHLSRPVLFWWKPHDTLVVRAVPGAGAAEGCRAEVEGMFRQLGLCSLYALSSRWGRLSAFNREQEATFAP